jgi:hypothetical protein
MRTVEEVKIVKVIVSDIINVIDSNIITPTRRVRLILDYGAIYDRTFFGFSVDENFVVQNFREEEDKWTKYEANKST